MHKETLPNWKNDVLPVVQLLFAVTNAHHYTLLCSAMITRWASATLAERKTSSRAGWRHWAQVAGWESSPHTYLDHQGEHPGARCPLPVTHACSAQINAAFLSKGKYSLGATALECSNCVSDQLCKCYECVRPPASQAITGPAIVRPGNHQYPISS
eukprot:1882261-Rhodomonas_salina.1